MMRTISAQINPNDKQECGGKERRLFGEISFLDLFNEHSQITADISFWDVLFEISYEAERARLAQALTGC